MTAAEARAMTKKSDSATYALDWIMSDIKDAALRGVYRIQIPNNRMTESKASLEKELINLGYSLDYSQCPIVVIEWK